MGVCAGGHLPSVTIEYRDVEIEADAIVGSSSVPNLTTAAWNFVKVGTKAPACGLMLQDGGLHPVPAGFTWSYNKSRECTAPFAPL